MTTTKKKTDTESNGATKGKVTPLRGGLDDKIVIPALETQVVTIKIVGLTPLLCSAMPGEVLDELDGKNLGKAKLPPEFKNADKQFVQALYFRRDGSYGFPSQAFRDGAAQACATLRNRKLTRNVFEMAVQMCEDLSLLAGKPRPRLDMGRNRNAPGNPAIAIRRAEFWPWEIDVQFDLDLRLITPAMLCGLLNMAGRGIGVGAWRPAKKGTFGRYKCKEEE
jgi:hypothetical protein